MILKAISKIAKAKKARFLQRKYERELDRQATIAAEIYDKIIARVEPKEILASIQQPISTEIKSILNALDEFGYIKQLPPLGHNPAVSVVIPHFNQHAYLPETLRALAQQSRVPEEIVVVDDQSDRFHEVEKICESFKQNLTINLIRPDSKLYTGKARETGVKAATGSIILMNDADDLSHTDRVELTRNTFMNFPDAIQVNVGVVTFSTFGGYIKRFDWSEAEKRILGPENISTRMKKVFVEQRFTIQENKFRVRRGWYGAESDFGAHDGSVAFRKEVIDAVHYSSLGHQIFTKWVDYEFNTMLFLAGHESYQIDLPLIYYRQGSSSFISGYKPR